MAHIHEVFDSDVHFSIDHISRVIKNETTNAKTKIIQYDHDSERFTFELPRHIEGHDMLTCNVVQVHYINIGGGNNRNRGLYEVTDLQVSPKDENVVICSWLISQNATQLVGTLNFVLRFVCTTDGALDYVWQTAVYNAIVVAEGIYNSEVIAEEYADILEQWRQELIEYGGVTDEQIAKAVSDYMAKNPVAVGSTATIGTVNLLAANWVGSANLYSQVVSIDGVTENSQVDLTPSVEQLVIFYEKDLTFVTENEDGVVTVYAIGQKPTNDYTIQVTITEVSV